MNDIQSADDLFEAFQEAAYTRLGEQDWTPLYAEKDERPRGEEVKRIVQSSVQPWVLFLNACEVAGANRKQFDRKTPNGWIDKPVPRVIEDSADVHGPNSSFPVEGKDTANSESFANLIAEMTGEGVDHLKVVILCRKARSRSVGALKKRPCHFGTDGRHAAGARVVDRREGFGVGQHCGMGSRS